MRIVYSELGVILRPLVGNKNRICQLIKVVSHQEPYLLVLYVLR